MPFARALATWQRLDWRRRRLLLEAAAVVPLAWLLLRVIPFKRVAKWLGRPRHETPGELALPVLALGNEIGWAVRAAAVRFPGEARCLVQGLAAAALARRHRVPATLYLGVARGTDDRLQAHAWVRCGNRVITGRAGHARFRVVESFAQDGVAPAAGSVTAPGRGPGAPAHYRAGR